MMCVVGVAPRGRAHRPSCRSSAVFSCAPAIEIRNSSSACCPNTRAPDTALSIALSTAASSNGTLSMRSKPSGFWSSGRSWTAPTQSRPRAASRSNVSALSRENFSAMRLRMASLSGKRLSKKFRTTSPRCGTLSGVNGSDSESRRPAEERRQASAYSNRCSPPTTDQVPTCSPFVHTASMLSRGLLRGRRKVTMGSPAGGVLRGLLGHLVLSRLFDHKPATHGRDHSCDLVEGRDLGRGLDARDAPLVDAQHLPELFLRQSARLAERSQTGAQLLWGVDWM